MILRAALGDSRAFTLTELLTTLALLGIIAVISVPVVSNLQVSSQLDDVTTEITMSLRAARSRSVARVDNATHGLSFALTQGAQSYTIYQIPNDWYVPNTAFDEVRQIPGAVSISTTLAPADIYFSRGLGVPNIASTQTITITHTSGGSRTITITPIGLVDAQ